MKRKGVLLIAGIVAIGAVFAAVRSGEKDFQALLEYEAKNRAFALLWTQKAAHDAKGANARLFWQAYSRLEQLSRTKYAPVLAKHGIDAEPSNFTETAVWASGFALSPDSQRSMEFMRKSAVGYIPKLERLQSLATDDHEFYEYVIAQEQVQADALGQAVEGDLKAGAATLDAFVEDHQD